MHACRSGPARNGIEATVQARPEEGGQIELHMVRHKECSVMHRILWAKKLIDTMILYINSGEEHELAISRRPSMLVCPPNACLSKDAFHFAQHMGPAKMYVCMYMHMCQQDAFHLASRPEHGPVRPEHGPVRLHNIYCTLCASRQVHLRCAFKQRRIAQSYMCKAKT
jgi:hypothetical protein